MPFSPSQLVLCHMSSPVVLDFALQVKHRQMDPWHLYVMAQMHPARSRQEHSQGFVSRLHFNDYKNAAMVRELTQGEG
jgi:hypothetical protein